MCTYTPLYICNVSMCVWLKSRVADSSNYTPKPSWQAAKDAHAAMCQRVWEQNEQTRILHLQEVEVKQRREEQFKLVRLGGSGCCAPRSGYASHALLPVSHTHMHTIACTRWHSIQTHTHTKAHTHKHTHAHGHACHAPPPSLPPSHTHMHTHMRVCTQTHARPGWCARHAAGLGPVAQGPRGHLGPA